LTEPTGLGAHMVGFSNGSMLALTYVLPHGAYTSAIPYSLNLSQFVACKNGLRS